MSFYLMLSSDGSKSTYPTNQGGDFKIMLDNVLDMKSQPWEVALVEMSYIGQTFPNMSTECSSINIQTWGKPEFENDYIITYEQTYDLWIQFTLKTKIGHLDGFIKTLKVEFPRQHFSWTSFKEILKEYYGSNRFGENWPTFVTIKDSLFTFSIQRDDVNTLFQCDFSPSFAKLFNIKSMDDVQIRHEDDDIRMIHLDVPITKPKVIKDTSTLIHTPYCIYKDVHFKVGSKRYLTFGANEYWTINMLKRALDGISANEVHEENDDDLKLINIVGERELTVEIANNTTNLIEGRLVKIHFSDGFMAALGIRNKNTEIKSIHRYRTQIEPIACREREDMTWPTVNYTTKEMSKKYFPNVSSLVTEINRVIIEELLEISRKRGSHEMYVDFFTLDEGTNIVTYQKKANFRLQLSMELVSLLNLDNSSDKGWLSETCQGSKGVVLKPHNRTHFYVHCDCIDYHFINNNVSHLIKIVNNNAQINEKVVQSFSFPSYYAVTRRIMSNINMYITENLFDNILEFDRDVLYTLHFRRCLHHHSS